MAFLLNTPADPNTAEGLILTATEAARQRAERGWRRLSSTPKRGKPQ